MRIIPVLDLMGGQVVQGIRGDRARYQPLRSSLTPSSAPLPVARALQAETNCDTFYIADLDAIERTADQRSTILALAEGLPANLWLDAGVSDVGVVQRWLDGGVDRVVVGSETLDSVASLQAIGTSYSNEQLVFSLDVQQGQVLSRCAELRAAPPLSVLDRLAAAGWSQVIVLTLDRVGTGGGPDWRLLENARRAFPGLSLIAGGGVRSIEELHRLSRMGMSGVLLASALHRGWINRHDLHSLTNGLGDGESSPDHPPQSGTQRD